MATQLIREVRAIDPSIELDQTVDLQVIDGEIAALAPELPHSLDDSADEVIEADNYLTRARSLLEILEDEIERLEN